MLFYLEQIFYQISVQNPSGTDLTGYWTIQQYLKQNTWNKQWIISLFLVAVAFVTTSQNRLVKYTIVLNIIVNMSSSEGKPGEDSTTSKEDPTSGGILLSQEGNGENLRMNCYSYLNSSKDDGLNRQDVDLYRRKLRSKMTKTKYVNVLAHKYYAKKHLLFIFLPIQMLSVWTTIAGAAFAFHANRT